MGLLRNLNRRFLLRYRLEYVAALVVLYGARCLSPQFAWEGARMVGRVAWLLGIRRRVALTNLERAFPDLDDVERRRVARKTYEHFASVVIDIVFQRRMLTPSSLRRRVRPAGWARKYLEEYGREGLRERARRMLFMTAHLGNWELGSGFFGMLGVKVAPVYRVPQNPYVARLLQQIRLGSQTEFIERRGAVQAMMECFDRGENVGFLFDQEAIHGLDVPFFGHPARTHKTPALLARDHDVRVMFGVMVRKGDFLHYEAHGDLYEEFPATGDRAEDLMSITVRWMERLEVHIRRFPDQYLWMHRRWKRAGVHG